MDFQELLAQNGGFWDKIGEGVVRCRPPTNSLLLLGLLPLCHFWQKLINKCDRESADRQTDGHTHRQRQTEFIICLRLYAISMGQKIKRHIQIYGFILLNFLLCLRQSSLKENLLVRYLFRSPLNMQRIILLACGALINIIVKSNQGYAYSNVHEIVSQAGPWIAPRCYRTTARESGTNSWTMK